MPPWQRRVGLLRQDPALFPHLSVPAEPGLRSRAGDRPGGESPGSPSGWASAGLLDDRPARLSGGQAHRVALGRLLASRCDALLLDEPYTGLDAGLRRDLTDLVRDLVAARQVPSVLVAHELEAAQAFADRMAVLDRGQILQAGPPAEVVAAPAGRRVAELVGYRSFVPLPRGGPPGTVAGVHPDRVVAGRTGRGPDAGRPGRGPAARPGRLGGRRRDAGTLVPVRLRQLARGRAGLRVHGAGPAPLRPGRNPGQPPGEVPT